MFCDRWVNDFIWLRATEHNAVVQTIGLTLPEFYRRRTYQITAPKRVNQHASTDISYLHDCKINRLKNVDFKYTLFGEA